jgi:hypothetical protein
VSVERGSRFAYHGHLDLAVVQRRQAVHRVIVACDRLTDLVPHAAAM